MILQSSHNQLITFKVHLMVAHDEALAQRCGKQLRLAEGWVI
jgi:predicted ABC-type transport system involved in lysophospholipase L1 biosynthesis ATPase subunit